jgi:hypothetical protein
MKAMLIKGMRQEAMEKITAQAFTLSLNFFKVAKNNTTKETP